MNGNATVHLTRDCEALQIPTGHELRLGKGTEVSIVQHLGGNYTVRVAGNLARIDAADADALGLIDQGAETTPAATADLPSAVRQVLGTCYDPEIPVDIVELGLVYRCDILPASGGGRRIEIDMTLTAPGCGMGAVLTAEIRRKLLRLAGIEEVDVRLVFDPPWDASRMSEVARLKLGLL